MEGPIPDWLPGLVTLDQYNGDWLKYITAVYRIFEHDFITTHPQYLGNKVSFLRNPVIQGKVKTFWHIVSEGPIEDDRLPELRRCERISWSRAIIENCHREEVKVFESPRGRRKDVCLWLEEHDYIVVLGPGTGYYLLLTSYVIKYPNKRRDLRREYEAYIALKG